MKKIAVFVVSGLMLALVAGGCKKKEEQPLPQAPMPPMQQQPMQQPMQQQPMGEQQMQQQPMTPPHPTPTGPKVEKKVVVPAEVKGQWSKVKLVLEEKDTKKANEFTVKIGSEYAVPNTDLKVKVGEFLPHFKMDGATLTSESAEPVNPAVRVEIFEGGKSVFKGWLFSKFPTMHPFEHPKYALLLKEGVK